MKLPFHLFNVILFFLDNGVSGVGSDVVPVSVKEGDSIIFHTGVQTNQQEDIKWYFNDTRIAQISGDNNNACTDVQCEDGDERFRDKLKLDQQSGSLTFTNIRTTDSGVYELKIISSSSSDEKIFRVTVNGVSAAEQDEMETKSVKERESITLESGRTQSPNEEMTWYINGDQINICTDVQCINGTERFRDRLKLDNQTGSLIIINTRTTDFGLYTLNITIKNGSFSVTKMKKFNVTVIAISDSGLSSAAVVGIVVAVILPLVAAAAGAVGVFYRRRRSHTAVSQNENIEIN